MLSCTEVSACLPPTTRILSLMIRAQLLAPALVCLPVSLPVLLAAVRRHHALRALDILLSLCALRVVASPLNLLAQAHVLWPVAHVVLMAAVRRDFATAAQEESHVLDLNICV
jgi:hypothetical protein